MTQVLVVGAGPTGLALACGLRAAGVDVRIADRAAGPATTSRALGLQPRGVEVLDRLGALADIPAHGLPIRQVIVGVDGREVARLRVGRPTRLVTRPGLMLSQATVERALRDRLAALGGHVEWGRELTGITPGPDGVTLHRADGGTDRAGWVVGCDGAHSTVRHAAGIGFPGVPLIERFLLADVAADWPLPRDAVATWLRGDQLFAIFPLPGGRWRLLAPQPAGTPGDLDEAARTAVLLRLLAAHAGLAADTVGAVLWTSAFRIHRRLADTYRAGRLLLAGDAAHVHSPFGGQGMNTGLGDAENLAWKLALTVQGRADDRLLDSYQAERRPVAADVLASTSGMTRLVLGGTPIARFLRDHVLVPLFDTAVVQRLISEASSQLRVSYRGGPLAGRTVGRPHPGDRVPDLPCRRADGSTHGSTHGSATRLHAELGHRFAVVAPDAALAASVARQAAVRLGPVAALVAPGPVRLIRPDGHLACRATPAREGAIAGRSVRDWLDHALGPVAGGARIGAAAA